MSLGVAIFIASGSVLAQDVNSTKIDDANITASADEKSQLKQRFYAAMQSGLEFGQCQSRVMYLAKSEALGEDVYKFNQENFDFAKERGEYSVACQQKASEFESVMKASLSGEFRSILQSEEMLDYSVILGICEGSFSVEDVFKTQKNISKIKYYDAYFEGQILKMFSVGSKAGFRESCLDVYSQQQKLVAITQVL